MEYSSSQMNNIENNNRLEDPIGALDEAEGGPIATDDVFLNFSS